MENKIRILLLTNRDSDNIGDQVIEACDISLIRLVMENLGINEDQCEIKSHAAGIVPKKYCETFEPELLKRADEIIQNSDVVIFGGAPMFNFLYQIFYERTSTIIELAQKYNVPVFFSAVGVEGYDEENERCQRLKKALNLSCVKRIATRDDFESLKKYKDREDLIISKVSDPAVFSRQVFENYLSGTQSCENNEEEKKIGIFIIRANAFTDNKIKYNAAAAGELWHELIDLIEKKGYSYDLISSGHFGDEAFMDRLIREGSIPEGKCVFNMNCPEDLLEKLSSYDAIVSCRLHPSIISYSLGIPSVSLVWNMKVKGFYDSIGYSDRVVEMADISAEKVFDQLEKAMDEGVHQDPDYLFLVYENLYYGIKESLEGRFDLSNCESIYSLQQVKERLPRFSGTSDNEKALKLMRKFRRTYNKYNDVSRDKRELKKELKGIKEEKKKLLRKIEKQKTTKSSMKRIVKNILGRK